MRACHICETADESAKRADSGRKRVTACEQSAIQYEQTYQLLKPNLSSLIVGFDQIDGSHNKDNRLNL